MYIHWTLHIYVATLRFVYFSVAFYIKTEHQKGGIVSGTWIYSATARDITPAAAMLNLMKDEEKKIP